MKEEECLITKNEGFVVAFMAFHSYFYGNSFIDLFSVDPKERRKGFAKKLMEGFEKVSPTNKIFSSANNSNLPMQKLLI
nr:GNAT family N-acetyltransferase [Neobacillus terrae]